MSKPKAALKTGDSSRYKQLQQKIAEHGTQEVEIIVGDRTVKSSRVLVVLEILFDKATDEQSLGAAQQYLDRILGKPKESLTLNDGDNIGKISDSELINRLIATLEKARERKSGDPGK